MKLEEGAVESGSGLIKNYASISLQATRKYGKMVSGKPVPSRDSKRALP